MEKITEVQCVVVSMSCDVCKDGVMKPTDRVFPSHPPKYPHMCTNCDNSGIYNKTYPCIEYRKMV
jgi:hypothetical protein